MNEFVVLTQVVMTIHNTEPHYRVYLTKLEEFQQMTIVFGHLCLFYFLLRRKTIERAI